MNTQITFDEKDYEGLTEVCKRTTVRAIIMRDGKLAMQCSNEGEYKIPGGGIEENEDHVECLVREVAEETGLTVIKESIRPLVETEEIRKDLFRPEQIFKRHTYFYVCDVTREKKPLQLTESEQEKGFYFTWATPEEICRANAAFTDARTVRDTEIVRRIGSGRLVVE
ncbi:MAG: NUDIX hydrolase [Roseburia sp.]